MPVEIPSRSRAPISRLVLSASLRKHRASSPLDGAPRLLQIHRDKAGSRGNARQEETERGQRPNLSPSRRRGWCPADPRLLPVAFQEPRNCDRKIISPTPCFCFYCNVCAIRNGKSTMSTVPEFNFPTRNQLLVPMSSPVLPPTIFASALPLQARRARR